MSARYHFRAHDRPITSTGYVVDGDVELHGVAIPTAAEAELAVGKVFAALPPILAVKRNRALVSRRCHSARACAGTGLSAQGFTVPSRNLVIRTLWEFLIVKSVEFLWVGNHIVGNRILLR